MPVNEMEAQEIMQDTSVQVWRRAHRYDAERSSPLAWIIMIARGLAGDRLRARSRWNASRAVFEREVASLEAEIKNTPPAERHEPAAACASVLNNLPESERRALQLAFLRGWTHVEIAGPTSSASFPRRARLLLD